MSEENKKVLITVETGEQFQAMIDHISAAEFITFDTETTGLDPRDSKVIGFSVSGDRNTGYYMPTYEWMHSTEELVPFYIDDPSTYDHYIQTALELLNTKKLIMHNASFDIRMILCNYGIDYRKALYCDTICLKHTVDENYPFGLKEIAKSIKSEIGLDVEEEANKEQIELKESIVRNGGSVSRKKYELFKADLDIIAKYAAADTILTYRVFEYYSKQLEEKELVKFFYEDEVMPLLKYVTIGMELNGINFDVDMATKLRSEIESDLVKLEDEIQEQIKPELPDFESWFLDTNYAPSNKGAFAQACIKYANLDLPLTSTGKYSLSKSNLASLSDSNTFVKFLRGGEDLPTPYVKEIQKVMFEESGSRYMLNITSKAHLRSLFFTYLKEKPTRYTPKDGYSVDNSFLETVREKYDFVPLLMKFNKLFKIKTAYYDRFISSSRDGVFYPRFFQHRTISGRYGSDLQQLNRPYEPQQLELGKVDPLVYKYTNSIRKLFKSGSGFKFVDADYESLEPHVFAHVSNDEGLRNIFRKGHDFYSTIAIATENIKSASADKKADNFLGKVDKPRRQKAKQYALGVPYGLGAYKLHFMLECSKDEAQRLVDNYLNSYPELKKWMEDTDAEVVLTGKVKSQAGRIRNMPEAVELHKLYGSELLDSLKLWHKYNESKTEYEKVKKLRRKQVNYLNNAKNFQIQSLAASITNRACIKIAKELLDKGTDGYVCAQIHDQIVVKVPNEEAEYWKNRVQHCMESAYELSLSLKAPACLAEDLYEGH